MAVKGFNAFEMAQKQFDAVADLLELDQPTRDLLRQPLREYHFSIPVRMDDGSVKVFQRLPRASTTTPAAPARAASASTPRRRSTRSAPWRCG
ncbi:MAG: hypothetical protein MZV64_12960 [Ignavibacteriales bacterium]|nr:hypothetical protein [Ignavibacteriales bacterium]